MTTGRINQVTIVRRGWPAGAAGGAGEIVQVTGRRHGGRALGQAPSPLGGRRLAAGSPLSPSHVPQGAFRRRRGRLPREGEVPGGAWAPQEGHSPRCFGHSASAARG